MDVEIARFNIAQLLEAGWTQHEIAEGIGITQASISKLSSGKTTRVRPGTSTKLRKFFERPDVQGVLSAADALSDDEARKAIRLYKFFRDEIASGSTIILRKPGDEDRHLVVLI